MAVSVMLADDHPVVRVGLKALLLHDAGLNFVGEAADGFEAVRLAETCKPDVMILDLMMPRLNGMQAIKEIKRIAPGTRIIILSMHANDSYVQEAFRNGADGYVIKDSVADDIVHAIHAVMAKRRYVSDAISRRLPDVFEAGAESGSRQESLTVRERQILLLIGQGLSNKELAEQLDISIRTVETHRARIMRKLGIKSHAALIRAAADACRSGETGPSL